METEQESSDADVGFIEGEIRTAYILLSSGKIQSVIYEVVNGDAILDGDIYLGPVEQVERESEFLKAELRGELVASWVISGHEKNWRAGVMPYTLDAELPDPTLVATAVEHWEQQTNFRFVQRTATNAAQHPDFVTFRPARASSSAVGPRGGQQFVNLGPESSTGSIVHLIGHAVGLWHEHARHDRDAYVAIKWQNLTPEGRHRLSQHISDGDNIGAYDYGSIMHYPRTAFSKNGLETISPIDPNASIGQRSGLSAGDIATANSMCATASKTVIETTKETTSETIEERFPETISESIPATIHERLPLSVRPIRAAPPDSGRRLITEFWHDRTVIRTVLPPATALLLEVKIAIPKKGEIAAEAAFVEPAHPGPSAPLEVVVTSSVWAAPKTQPMSLPTAHRDQPSTSVVFPLTTPSSGSVVEFDVVVYYQRKPLQAAKLTASVRDVAVPSDRPSLLTYTLSGPDEPTPNASPVDVSLDARGAELRSTSGAALLITDVKDMLDAFEDMLSRVLGVEDAPHSFDDERALRLLIDLARKGSLLRVLLSQFRLDKARSINLLVSTSTPVLPLELVYDGTAPMPGAKLCQHVFDPPKPGESCTRTSTRTVCPYAFWGMHRVVSRTVADETKRVGPVRVSIAPVPILYAATSIADRGAVAPAPSDQVVAVATRLFGPIKRVTSWRAWRKSVREEHPQLLVVLGHTQLERGELKLHIGKTSVLARPDVNANVLRVGDVPPPLLVLMACATAQVGDPFGNLPGIFTAHGAGAVVGTLSKINGPQGAQAAISVLNAIHDAGRAGQSLGEALAAARRALVKQQLLLGLILVSHGEIDTKVTT